MTPKSTATASLTDLAAMHCQAGAARLTPSELASHMQTLSDWSQTDDGIEKMYSFADFHATVIDTARRAAAEASGGAAEGDAAPRVMCRFTHVYPDGPAPYFTILAPARRGDEVAQWHEIKRAAPDAVLAAGGTITHHHAVGRDHRPWYDAQRPEPFAAALRAAKGAVDPTGMLNPGVLLDR